MTTPPITASDMGRKSGAIRQAAALLRRGHELTAVAHLLPRPRRQAVAAELRSIADAILAGRPGA